MWRHAVYSSFCCVVWGTACTTQPPASAPRPRPPAASVAALAPSAGAHDPKKTGAQPAATEAAPAAPLPGFSGQYRGTIAGKPVQAKLELSGNEVVGQYRYGRALQDLVLRGHKEDGGAFRLEERNEAGVLTGIWQLETLDRTRVVGQWSSPDGAKRHPIALVPGAFIELVRVGTQARLYAVKASKSVDGCSYDVTFPQVGNVRDKALEQAMNERLRELGMDSVPSFCDEPPTTELGPASASRSYSVTVLRPPFVGLRFDYEMASNGAHGIHGSECYVLDTNSGRTFKLVEKLGPAQRGHLSQLLNEVKRRDPGVREIEASGAHTAELTIDDSSALCLIEDGIEVQLSDYELGGYALGRASFVLPAAQVRTHFDAAISRALFP